MKKLVNGVPVDCTPEEDAAFAANEAAEVVASLERARMAARIALRDHMDAADAPPPDAAMMARAERDDLPAKMRAARAFRLGTATPRQLLALTTEATRMAETPTALVDAIIANDRLGITPELAAGIRRQGGRAIAQATTPEGVQAALAAARAAFDAGKAG